MIKYLQCWISAENKNQADQILDSLLQKKLVAGGLISNAPARFWWKGKITNTNYYNISVFTIKKHKQLIIKSVKKISNEETPLIWFVAFEGNKGLLEWINDSLK